MLFVPPNQKRKVYTKM